jgi:putative ABC transport system permease protein
MNMENHIWNLATKKLSDEASEQELRELDNLLQQNPDIYLTITQLFNWWHYDEEQNLANRSELLFSKIKAKIRQAEKNNEQNEDGQAYKKGPV